MNFTHFMNPMVIFLVFNPNSIGIYTCFVTCDTFLTRAVDRDGSDILVRVRLVYFQVTFCYFVSLNFKMLWSFFRIRTPDNDTRSVVLRFEGLTCKDADVGHLNCNAL